VIHFVTTVRGSCHRNVGRGLSRCQSRSRGKVRPAILTRAGPQPSAPRRAPRLERSGACVRRASPAWPEPAHRGPCLRHQPRAQVHRLARDPDNPLVEMPSPVGRRARGRRAITGPTVRPQRRRISSDTSMPRSARSSSPSRHSRALWISDVKHHGGDEGEPTVVSKRGLRATRAPRCRLKSRGLTLGL
jgi:hypothetical protein